MSISIISQSHVAGTADINSFTSSVTAQAGDVIELVLQYRNLAGASFTPVWNGQSFIELAARTSATGFFFHRFYLVAASSATANITGGTSPTFTVLNRAWRVWRSSTNAFATPPFKAGSYQSVIYSSGTYTNPTLSNTVTSSDVVSAVFASPNWDTGFSTGTATFTEVSPSVNIGEAVSSYVPAVEFLRSFYTVGTGSVVSELAKTGAHNPMYQYSTVILQETAYLITSINGGNPITANQATVLSVTTGFTGLPTSITCNLAGITCSSIGGTTNAPTFVKSQRVNGSPWPLNGATATFTYVNGSESASGTQVIQKEAGDVVYTFSGVINDDPASIGYWLTQDGFTVEGGEHSYTPYGDLVLTADGGGTVTDAGTFTSWFRPSTGTGAGNVYSYTWTISEAGIAVVSRGQMPSLAIGYGIGI